MLLLKSVNNDLCEDESVVKKKISHRRMSEQLLKRRISMEEKVRLNSQGNLLLFICFNSNFASFFFQLAEVISHESSLKEENRRMSIIIAEAEEVAF